MPSIEQAVRAPEQTLTRIGFLQFEPRIGQVEKNVEAMKDLLSEAPPFDLLVLPELASSGYAFRDRDELESCAEIKGNGPFTNMLSETARSRDCYLVGGFPESAEDGIYNSCILCGPDGIVGLYRKAHLFLDEKDYFLPGDTPFPVFPTRIGRIGLLICFDWAFPEAWRILALKQADLVAHPSNLVTPYAQQVVPVHAMTNAVWTITANRTGTERGIPFTGNSFIADPKGNTVAVAEKDETAVRIITADLTRSGDKMITGRNHLIHDRRKDLYADLK